MDTDMVWDTADTTDTDIPVLTDMPITTLARGLLMPNLKPMLMLPLMPTMATMAVTDTVWDTVDTTDTDIPVLTDMPITTLARGLLMPNLKPMLMLPLMPTMATTAVDTDMVMAVDTMVDT